MNVNQGDDDIRVEIATQCSQSSTDSSKQDTAPSANEIAIEDRFDGNYSSATASKLSADLPYPPAAEPTVAAPINGNVVGLGKLARANKITRTTPSNFDIEVSLHRVKLFVLVIQG